MPVNKKLIAKNTIMLYIRMFITMAIQLYTSRVILQTLGVSDYGIYSVVGGVITMFGFVKGSLNSGTQRFLAYAIGKDDKVLLKKFFDANITVFAIFSAIAFVLLETVGVWFLNNKLVIEESRMTVANWVFQFSIVSFVIDLISTPYNGAIIAHEKMGVYAYTSILNSVLKLVIVFLVMISPIDYLLTYGFLQMLVALLFILIIQIYCRVKFDECKSFCFEWDKLLLKDLLSYAGLNVIGSLAWILCTSGINIVQNMFFGTMINSAHAIAGTVSGTVQGFVDNINVASKPQITKSYASHNEPEMWSLVFQSGKLTFFLFIMIGIPLYIELPYVLSIWLANVPEYSATISRLMLITIMLVFMYAPLVFVFQAANKQKHIQLYSAAFILLSVPVSYTLLCVWKNVLIPYCVNIGLYFIVVIIDLYFAKKDLNLDVSSYLYKVIFKEFGCLIFSMVLTYVLLKGLETGVIKLLLTIITSLVLSCVVIWIYGLEKAEKKAVISMLTNNFNRTNG